MTLPGKRFCTTRQNQGAAGHQVVITNHANAIRHVVLSCLLIQRNKTYLNTIRSSQLVFAGFTSIAFDASREIAVSTGARWLCLEDGRR